MVLLASRILGLTPQAIHMPPLRGSSHLGSRNVLKAVKRALEARQMFSLGREPQDRRLKKDKPRSGGRCQAREFASIHQFGGNFKAMNLSPLRGSWFYWPHESWGSRPRLCICRASGAHINHHVAEPRSGEYKTLSADSDFSE